LHGTINYYIFALLFKALGKEQRTKSKDQRAKNKDQRTKIKEQRSKNKDQRTRIKEQRGLSNSKLFKLFKLFKHSNSSNIQTLLTFQTKHKNDYTSKHQQNVRHGTGILACSQGN